ncbi:MAG: hypothetical protein KIS66_11140 [Fimbriimonadaceae bacterium]|nr:hypothetical protein [Fimbriimonadaceae bacterium]
MKALTRIGLAVALLGLLGLVASWAVPANYASRARLVQRVKPHDADLAAMTGEVGAFIGPPELMIVEDPKAFLPGIGEGGALLADDDYMRAHGVYPLQLKSVDTVGRYARLGSGAALLLGVGVAWFARRRQDSLRRKRHPVELADGSV